MIEQPHCYRLPTGRLLRVAAAVLLCCASVSFALAQQPAGVEADENPAATAAAPGHPQGLQPPLRFIRVFAPAAEPQTWPRGPGRYIPMQADRFERLLQCAAAAGGRLAAPPAGVREAVYHARLEKGGVLRGTARLQIDLRDKGPVLMPLEPCGLVVSGAVWEADSGAKAVGNQEAQPLSPAVVGSHGRDRIELLVERCGTIALDWMLRGGQSIRDGTVAREAAAKRHVERKRLVDTEMAFDVTLPKCPSNVLILDLPPQLVPHVERAIISAAEESPQSTAAGPQRWRIELGGRNRFKLRLAPSDDSSEPPSSVVARQSLLYHISERGLEVSSTVRLEVGPASIVRVNVLVDRDLQVIHAQCGDQPATWSLTPAENGKSNRVTLQLPVSARGEGLDVQLRACCPVVAGRVWRLPRIRPQSVVSDVARDEMPIFWQQGVATLVVADPLEIIDLQKIDCRQLKVTRLQPPSGGESVQLQMFSRSATAELVLSPSISPPKVDCGVAVDLDASGITAKLTATFSHNRHKHFRIEADLAPQWIIDSLRSLPAGAVDDWEVQDDADGSRRLVVRLSEPLSAAWGSLRLLVALHNPRSALRSELPLGALVPLSFPTCHHGKTLLAVHAMEPHQLKCRGDVDVPLHDAGAMPDGDLRLFAQPPKGLVLSPHAADETLRVSLQRRQPSYDATIHVEASAVEESLSESYRIRCWPQNAHMERLLVHLSAARRSALSWCLNAQDNRQLAARRLTAPEAAAAGLGQKGETWEIALPQPFDTAFEITASRSSRTAEKMGLSLAALPEATQQRGELVVKSPALSIVRFENHCLEPMLPRAEPAGRYSATRAAYRYDPRRLLNPSAEAMISVLPTPVAKPGGEAAAAAADSPPSAWVWSGCLESRFQSDGTACHWACYHIENAGRGWLKLELPSDVDAGDVVGVWVNDQATTWQTESGADRRAGLCRDAAGREPKSRRASCGSAADGMGKKSASSASPVCDARPQGLRIGLPEGLRFVVVRVNFTTTAVPLGMAASLRPPLPSLDIPTLRQHWTVWLPPSYASLAGEYESAVGYAAAFASPSAAERIFGPLGRPLHEQRFNPLSAAAWQRVAAGRFAARQDTRWATVLLERIGRISQQNPTAAAVFSSELLSSAHRPFLFDAEALARAGFTPTTVLAPHDDEQLAQQIGQTAPRAMPAQQAADRGVRLFRDRGLALLSHERTVVLTTLQQAAVFADHLQPLGSGVVWRVKAGALHDWISSAAASLRKDAQPRELLSASEWTALPDGLQMPWTASAAAQLPAADMPGWTAVQLDISGRAAACLPIIHRRAISIFRLTAFIVALAAGWWKGRNRPLRTAAVAAVFAIAALLTPVVVAAICSGVVSGLLFCLICGFVCRKAHSAAPQSGADVNGQKPASAVSTAAYISSGVVLVLVLLSGQAAGEIEIAAVAAESSAADTQAMPVPVAVGPHEALRDSGSRSAEIRHAFTDGAAEVPDVRNQRPPAHAEQAARIYRVFVPVDKHREAEGSRVFVPAALYEQLERRFVAATARPHGWLLTSAVYRGAIGLRGRLQRPVVEELHASFQIMLFEPEAEVHVRLDQHDVSLATSACRLDGRAVRPRWSGDGRSIVVPVRQPGRHRLELALRPIDKPNLLDMAIPQLVASRLELVLPVGETSLEAPSVGGEIKRENGTFFADFSGRDRLMVRLRDDQVGLPSTPLVESDELLWLRIRPGSVVVEAKFLFKVNAGEVRELVLQADPRLRLLENGDSAEIVEVPGEPHLRLIRLSTPCCDHAVVTARFLVREASGVGHFQPPRLRLSNVVTSTRMLAVSVDSGLDFSHNGQQPAVGRSIGEFMASWGQSVEKPQFVCAADEIDPRWNIATRPRRPPLDVVQRLRVTFEKQRIGVRLHAELKDTPGRGFQYKIAAPRSLVVENVSVIEEGAQRVSRWTRCGDGTVNVFLDGPAAVARTLSLEGHMPKPRPRKKFHVPWFRLENSKQKAYRVALFSDPALLISVRKQDGLIESDWPHVEDSAGVPAADRETPRDAAIRKPTDNSSREAAADRVGFVKAFIADGMQAVDLEVDVSANPDATAEAVAPAPHVPAHVTAGGTSVGGPAAADAFPDGGAGESVFTRSPAQDLGQSGVCLADINVVWHLDGTCCGTASFDLLPNGHRWCPLLMPGNLRLIEARLGGIAAVAEPVNPVDAATTTGQANNHRHRVYRLQLASRSLPQRIEVVFQGRLVRGRWRRLQDFDPPRLGDLDVEKTLWRVSSPRRFVPCEPVGGVDRLKQAMIRLENVAAIIEQAAAPAGGTDELRDWYRLWAVRYACARRDVQRTLPLVDRTELVRSTSARIEQLDARGLTIAQKLAAEDVLRDCLSGPRLAADAQDFVKIRFDSSSRTALASLDAANGVRRCGNLSFRRAETSNVYGRIAAALGIAILMWLVYRGGKRGLHLASMWRRPQLLGAAAGLVWWLWLTPSLLGLVIAAVCLADGLRRGAWGKRRRSGASIRPSASLR